MSEQRRAERENTYKAARIGAGARATLHCGVWNLSATGACLRVDDPSRPACARSCGAVRARSACAST